MSTGLFLMFTLNIRGLLNGLTESECRLIKCDIDFVFIFHLGYNNIKLLITNTIDQRLFVFFISNNAKCLILCA